MNIEKVNSAPKFEGLHLKKVANEHMHFINADLKELQKLGEQYDIYMKSYINSDLRCDGIGIIVKELRKNLAFLHKFHRPYVKSYFYTEPHYDTKNSQTTLSERIKSAAAILPLLK